MFSWLRNLVRRSPPAQPANLSEHFYYAAAYSVFPNMALTHPDVFDDWQKLKRPEIMFAMIACSTLGCPPEVANFNDFAWHRAKLNDGRDFVAVEYPTPKPISVAPAELESISPEEMFKRVATLGPFFSVWVGDTNNPADSPNLCYVLGQSPHQGLTTLRRVTLAGHYNLGPGPEPNVDALIQAVQDEPTLPVRASHIQRPELKTEVDEALLKRLRGSED